MTSRESRLYPCQIKASITNQSIFVTNQRVHIANQPIYNLNQRIQYLNQYKYTLNQHIYIINQHIYIENQTIFTNNDFFLFVCELINLANFTDHLQFGSSIKFNVTITSINTLNLRLKRNLTSHQPLKSTLEQNQHTHNQSTTANQHIHIKSSQKPNPNRYVLYS